MSKKLKKELKKICIALGLFVVGMILEGIVAIPFLLASYVLVGWPVIKKAFKNIQRGNVMDENFLMTIATFGAFLLGDLGEAAAVMLFFQTGEWFQSYAVGKSRKSISDLMDICPEYANVKREGGTCEVSPEEVQVGEIIVIKPGERVPLDGVIVSGFSSLDTKAMSGESVPRDVCEGDAIVSGCINLSAVLEVEVTKAYENSTVAKVLELVENASANKAEAEQFISKFARVYTTIVVYSALALAFVPPMIVLARNVLGILENSVVAAFGTWIYRGLAFLVTSCPCALVISIPLSFFGGIGAASKEGILIKGSNYLEALASVDTVVMDKTGTLTEGVFGLQEVHANEEAWDGVNAKETFLRILAHVEALSNHPIAKSIVQAYLDADAQNVIDEQSILEMQEIPGKGVKVRLADGEYYGGNDRLMEELGFADLKEDAVGTIVHLAKRDTYLGYAVVADTLKKDAVFAIAEMKKVGVSDVVMLTGDKEAVALVVAKQLGIQKVYAELLPIDKVAKVEEMLAQKEATGKLLFVGDGMNDAPVLARADVGIAMGGMGSDAAIEAADIVIMTDQPSKIAKAIKISRKTKRIVRQNIVGAIGVKALVLLLVAAGFVGMWAAVFADVGVAFIAILNAMRAMRTE